MKMLSILLPATLLGFLALMGLCYRTLEKSRGGINTDQQNTLPYDNKDKLLSWGLALVYAVVAFWGLGDRTAPESYARLSHDAQLSFTLPADSCPISMVYFAGIDPGEWTMELSQDGENWDSSLSVDMNYVAVLKWNRVELPQEGNWRYFRIQGYYPMEIGEMAFLDGQEKLIAPVAVSQDASPLFDEQDGVCTEQTYRNSTYFDEIYHARTAWESLRCDGMYEITHPPLGKIIIALGLKLFGVNPFGWRFSGTMAGVLMLPLLYAFIRRLFGSRRVSIACTVVFALDFMHFTQTRIATIDSYSVLFILGMYYYMYRFVSEEGHSRFHLGLSGLFFGLGAASKWTCLYAGAGLGLIWLIYWIQNRQIGKKAFWKNVLFCMGAFVALPLGIYYISYWPYGVCEGLSGVKMLFSGDYLRIVLDNQRYMFSYHSDLVATHPYSSKWYQWVLDIRPILYYANYEAETRSIIMAFTSPLLCWGGLLGMIAVGRRSLSDKRAGFILLGYLAQLLPWVLVSRLTFAYHYFPSEIFLVAGLGYVLSKLEERGEKRFTVASIAIAVGLFALFYPCLSGAEASNTYCQFLLRWFPTWPV